MNQDEARERLRELTRLEDDWFRLRTGDDPNRFIVEAGFGAADVILSERWVEVAAIRPLDRLMQAAGESVRGRGALLCATMLPHDTRLVAFRGRVYLDGFTEHTFFVTAGEVLQLAGPATAPAAGERVVRHEEGARTETAAAAPVETPAAAQESAPVGSLAEELPAPEPTAAGTKDTALLAPERAEEPSVTTPAAGAGLRWQPVEEVAREGPSATTAGQPPPQRDVAPTIQIARPRAPAADDAAPPTIGPRPCPRCGETVQPGERFCIGCGAAIPPSLFAQPASAWARPPEGAGAVPPATQPIECPRCRFVNPPANRFCQGCGTRLAG